MTIFRMRSTSPPKSAWPGVSTMLILVSPYWMAVFLARMVMPPLPLRSLESMTRFVSTFLVHAALLEHLVHQGGLAVVHMGDNGYVSQFFVLQRKNPFLWV